MEGWEGDEERLIRKEEEDQVKVEEGVEEEQVVGKEEGKEEDQVVGVEEEEEEEEEGEDEPNVTRCAKQLCFPIEHINSIHHRIERRDYLL